MPATAPSYAYNASAIALGGVLRKGKHTTVIPTVGSVCLASAGGEGSNTVDNYFRDDISFTRAHTRVSGYSTPIKGGTARRYFTYSDVLLTNLQIFDRLKISFMQATVTSTRVIDTTGDADAIWQLQPDRSEFSIRLFYEGILVDGEEVAPTVDFDLCHAGSYDEFLQRAVTALDATDDETREVVEKVKNARDAKNTIARFAVEEDETAKRIIPWHRPPVNVPLVKLEGPPGLITPHGNRANVAKFGKARFGDAVIKPDRQRVTLLRLSLDDDWSKTFDPMLLDAVADEPQLASDPTIGGGSLSSGDGGSNGVPIWP